MHNPGYIDKESAFASGVWTNLETLIITFKDHRTIYNCSSNEDTYFHNLIQNQKKWQTTAEPPALVLFHLWALQKLDRMTKIALEDEKTRCEILPSFSMLGKIDFNRNLHAMGDLLEFTLLILTEEKSLDIYYLMVYLVFMDFFRKSLICFITS